MKILLSNDDGVYAPGIQCLAKVARELGHDVQVMGPDRNRSGASNSLTLEKPLRVHHLPNGDFAVEGTPTDSVHLALSGFLDWQPDLVLSGINSGANLAEDVLYSGTVAAAMEGLFLGFPAMAFSLVEPYTHFATAEKIAKKILASFSLEKSSKSTLLNVNIPDVPVEQIRGFEITRLGRRHSSGPNIVQTDPKGKKVYWIGNVGPEQDASPGTDFYAIQQHCVSITPLQTDLTYYQVFEDYAHWFSSINL